MAVLIIAVAVVAVVLVIHIARRSAPNPRTMTLTGGTVEFSDQFSGGVGWPDAALSSGSTVGHGDGDYFISGQGPFSHFVAAPFGTPYQAEAISVTAEVKSGDPKTSGYGVQCTPATTGQPSYAFFLNPNGTFVLDRYQSAGGSPAILDEGSTSGLPGIGRSVTFTAGCILVSATGGRAKVRLVLAVGRSVIADIIDSASGSGTGWTAGLVTSTTAAQPSVVDFTAFEIRNLEG
jgi:hypothetical protein